MRVLLFGATGMVGQGVLRECLLDPRVTSVVAVTRSLTGVSHPKLRELVHKDFFDFRSIENELTGHDACFFCLGVSSVGKSESEYARTTYDITLAAARTIAKRNPGVPFVYVSGAGTDSTEEGRSMWARVKGRTENELLKLPLRACLFRPGFIQPANGAKSKTTWYRVFYALTGPVAWMVDHVLPGHIATTATVGRAMIAVANDEHQRGVFESRDIARLGRTEK